MHTRTLGQGLQVSAIGLGCMGMSQGYGPNPGTRTRTDMIDVLRSAVDYGVLPFSSGHSSARFRNWTHLSGVESPTEARRRDASYS